MKTSDTDTSIKYPSPVCALSEIWLREALNVRLRFFRDLESNLNHCCR